MFDVQYSIEHRKLSIEHSSETRDTPFDGLRASRACRGTLHEERALRTAFANEDAGALFPDSLGETATRALHQYGPSHGLVPSGRRLDEVPRDAIDRGVRFQSALGLFPNRHVSAVDGEEVGHREAAFVDVSNFDNLRGQAGPFGIVGNTPSGLPDLPVLDRRVLHQGLSFLALGIHDVGRR